METKMYQDPDLHVILSAAFRYAKGRMTYVPSTFIAFCKRHAEHINVNTMILMEREIRETPDEQLGWQCDIDDWRAFGLWLKGQIHQRRAGG